jgi:predicted Fe-Mo cluster-binding NifX family protein/predicted DNA-binding protein (UPF0251 family)
MPEIREFHPVREILCQSAVVLSVDEYEAIRLIDRQGFSQEECGRYMQVARTTVQMIYDSARKKLAEALVSGLPLKIEGGDFKLCDGKEEYCGCGGCRRHRRKQMLMQHKEDGKMRIAIPLDENRQDICIVLSRAPYFLFQDEDSQTIVENPAAKAQDGAGVQAAQFLVDNGVNVLITVRCGQNAADVFTAAGMKIYKSAGKTAAEDLEAFAEGSLEELTHFHDGYHGNL